MEGQEHLLFSTLRVHTWDSTEAVRKVGLGDFWYGSPVKVSSPGLSQESQTGEPEIVGRLLTTLE
jgi:hypothetical protein